MAGDPTSAGSPPLPMLRRRPASEHWKRPRRFAAGAIARVGVCRFARQTPALPVGRAAADPSLLAFCPYPLIPALLVDLPPALNDALDGPAVVVEPVVALTRWVVAVIPADLLGLEAVLTEGLSADELVLGGPVLTRCQLAVLIGQPPGGLAVHVQVLGGDDDTLLVVLPANDAIVEVPRLAGCLFCCQGLRFGRFLAPYHPHGRRPGEIVRRVVEHDATPAGGDLKGQARLALEAAPLDGDGAVCALRVEGEVVARSQRISLDALTVALQVVTVGLPVVLAGDELDDLSRQPQVRRIGQPDDADVYIGLSLIEQRAVFRVLPGLLDCLDEPAPRRHGPPLFLLRHQPRGEQRSVPVLLEEPVLAGTVLVPLQSLEGGRRLRRIAHDLAQHVQLA